MDEHLRFFPWPQDKSQARGNSPHIFSLLFSLEFLRVQAPCLPSSQLVLPGNSWWMFSRSKLEGGLRERRTNLNGKKCNGERQHKEMLNTRQCFLSVHSHNHGLLQALLCSSLACETLQAVQIHWFTRFFSKQTRLKGVSATRNTLNKLMDFDLADVSPTTCEFNSRKK